MALPFLLLGLASKGAQGALKIQAAKERAQMMIELADERSKISELNAEMSEINAKQAKEAGDQAATQIEFRQRKLRGAQRSALAASGVDTGFGSGAEIQAESEMIANLDMATVKNNAYRQAWGFKMEAAGTRLEAAYGKLAASKQASATIKGAQFDAAGGLLEGLGFGLMKK